MFRGLRPFVALRRQSLKNADGVSQKGEDAVAFLPRASAGGGMTRAAPVREETASRPTPAAS